MYIQYKSLETFSDSQITNSLLIKKTNNFNKVYGNSKYTIWIPQPIDDYYPIGNYIKIMTYMLFDSFYIFFIHFINIQTAGLFLC